MLKAQREGQATASEKERKKAEERKNIRQEKTLDNKNIAGSFITHYNNALPFIESVKRQHWRSNDKELLKIHKPLKHDSVLDLKKMTKLSDELLSFKTQTKNWSSSFHNDGYRDRVKQIESRLQSMIRRYQAI